MNILTTVARRLRRPTAERPGIPPQTYVFDVVDAEPLKYLPYFAVGDHVRVITASFPGTVVAIESDTEPMKYLVQPDGDEDPQPFPEELLKFDGGPG